MGVTRTCLRFCRNKIGTMFLLLMLMGVALFFFNFIGSIHSQGSPLTSRFDTDEVPVEKGIPQVRHGPDAQNSFKQPQKGNRRRRPWDEDDENPIQAICQVPRLGTQGIRDKDSYQKMPPLQCAGEHLFYTRSGDLHINETVLGGRDIEKCRYTAIEWGTDQYHIMSKPYIRTTDPFTLRIKHDFFRVECWLNKSNKYNENKHKLRNLLENPDENPEENVEDNLQKAHMAPRLTGSMGMPDPPVMGRNYKYANKKKTGHDDIVQNVEQIKYEGTRNTDKLRDSEKDKLPEEDIKYANKKNADYDDTVQKEEQINQDDTRKMEEPKDSKKKKVPTATLR